MLVKGSQDAQKSKLMSAFNSNAQSVTCYVQRRVGIHHKATIYDLKLEESL
jgi:hypothetical protein